MVNIRTCKKVHLQKLINLDFLDSILFGIVQEPFGNSFLFPFPAKCFTRSLQCLNFKYLSLTLEFVNGVKFRRFKRH